MTLRDRFKAEFAEYDAAVEALRHAFNEPDTDVESCEDAEYAARRVARSADRLAVAAFGVARELQETDE